MIKINPIRELNAEISVPGDKYIANRVLIIASLCDGRCRIKNLPDNEDINNAIDALRKFGIDIKKKKNYVIVDGSRGILNESDQEINIGNSGTFMRFITGLASLVRGQTKITGSKRIKQRPIKHLLESLEDLGVSCDSHNDFPPVMIKSDGLVGGKTRISGDISSQYISSLLLVAPYAKNDVTIELKSPLVSKKYVDMTIDIMERFGVRVKRDDYDRFIVKSGQRYKGRSFMIPADWCSASYFLGAAAIIPGSVKITGLDMGSQQGESKFADTLIKMGCMYRKKRGFIQMIGLHNIQGIDIDMSSMPDVVQTLAGVACFASGTTRIRNISHLKYKESDRLNDTADELRKTGADVRALNDELVVRGGKCNSAVIDPHNDHRMAMSFAMIGLKCGMVIKNPQCVNKSFPGFWDKLREIGAVIEDA